MRNFFELCVPIVSIVAGGRSLKMSHGMRMHKPGGCICKKELRKIKGRRSRISRWRCLPGPFSPSQQQMTFAATHE